MNVEEVFPSTYDSIEIIITYEGHWPCMVRGLQYLGILSADLITMNIAGVGLYLHISS